jgi:type III secretion system FlhB-like substrate exporter
MKFGKPSREIAVSVEYDDLSDLPKIGARGERHVAREMRNIAIRYGVPLASNRTLAEQLGKCSPLEALPEELYEELAYVIYNQTRRNY